MKVELEAKNIIIDRIDVFNHIGKVEKEANELVQRINKVIPMLKELNIKLKEILKIGIDIKEITDIEEILKGVEEK